MTGQTSIRPCVAVISTRPETVQEDIKRAMRLASLGGRPLSMAPAPVLAVSPAVPGPGAAGACTPWLLDGCVQRFAASGWAVEDMRAVFPSRTSPRAELDGALRRILQARGVGVDTAPLDGDDLLLLSGVAAGGRVGLRSVLVGLLHYLVPDIDTTTVLHRPDQLISIMRRLPVDRCRGAVVDATVCVAGSAAAGYEAVDAQLVIAGADPVAIDTVVATLCGIDPSRLPLQAAAVAAGLGVGTLDAIRLVGEPHAIHPDLRLHMGSPTGVGQTTRDLPHVMSRLMLAFRGLDGRGRRQRCRFESTPWGRFFRDNMQGRDERGGCV